MCPQTSERSDGSEGQMRTNKSEKLTPARGLLELGSQLAILYQKSQQSEDPEKAPNAYLKDGPELLAPSDSKKQLDNITREDFASPQMVSLILEASAHNIDTEGQNVTLADNHIYTVRYTDGSQTAVVLRNEDTINEPWGKAAKFKPTAAWLYQWDGKNHMVGIEPSGKVTDITDDTHGKPESALGMWRTRDNIGRPVGAVEFSGAKK